jgi:hypothetical protein
MKLIPRFMAVLVLVPLTVTWGDDVKTFNWTPPTQNTNGTPLSDAEIGSYNIYCNGTLLGTVPNTGGTDTWTSPILAAGDYTCEASTINTAGTEGPRSNQVNFTVDPSVPGAPENFTVTFP